MREEEKKAWKASSGLVTMATRFSPHDGGKGDVVTDDVSDAPSTLLVCQEESEETDCCVWSAWDCVNKVTGDNNHA